MEPATQQIVNEREEEAVTIETNREEEYLQTLIITEKEDEGMEVDTQRRHSATKLPANVPSRKGKAKVPKDLYETKSSL